jgi:hypothetical protein
LFNFWGFFREQAFFGYMNFKGRGKNPLPLKFIMPQFASPSKETPKIAQRRDAAFTEILLL